MPLWPSKWGVIARARGCGAQTPWLPLEVCRGHRVLGTKAIGHGTRFGLRHVFNRLSVYSLVRFLLSLPWSQWLNYCDHFLSTLQHSSAWRWEVF